MGERATWTLAAAALACLGACVDANHAHGPELAPSRPASAEGGDVLYYSDLGPDAIDVSSYPVKRQYGYQVFSRVCSQCHTLARAVNAPAVGRDYWEFYLLRMKLYSRFISQPVSRDETRSILDFLEYDSGLRKIKRRREFQALTERLKRRYDAEIVERLGRFQAEPRQPQLMPSSPRRAP